MVVFPNAKINLGLNITARRKDGYHDLVTAMVPVPWCDILEIVPARGTTTALTVTGRGCDCPPESNLVMKAYRALDQAVGLPPVDIHLHKIIPDGAGLGGGSSDAAFTLSALNGIFALGLDPERLAAIAATLGADCPFFIFNRPMLATGTGTDLAPMSIPGLAGLSVTIVKPPVSISTAAAYANVRPAIPPHPLTELLSQPAATWRDAVVNDFEQSLRSSHPELYAIKQSLYAHGAVYASLSGSGSAVYGLFTSDKMAESALEGHPGCATFAAPLA